MRAIPIAQREAYVARATSGKAQWQIENIRRTLEHLGLLVPAGVAAGGLAQAE
jgi:pyruvate/2-oxoacid:ferredoxin oxidoreductase beta subunit